MLMRTNAERREDFPPPGEVPPKAGIGVHFHRAKPGCLVFSGIRESRKMKSSNSCTSLFRDSPFGGWRHHLPLRKRWDNKTIQPGFRPWENMPDSLRSLENHTTAPLARRNAPLLPPAAASSPEGQILAALCFEMLMRTNAERRADFPLRVEVPPKAGIGVHFHGRSPVCLFFYARQGGFLGFIIMAPFIFKGAHHNPRATGASNL